MQDAALSFEFRIFCEVIMAMRARATYCSADEVSRLLWEENDGSERESGTSEEEEAELEHQLRIFNEESSEVESEDDNIEDSPVAGSQSLPNLYDMLTILQRTCTLNFIFLSPSILLVGCFQVEIMPNLEDGFSI
ncbi:uncharacterized protein LOC122953827 isoform X3 [Acropora millepora]|uniref:uncharacterized protein LOC122953827 isoform X3 n=1 Tax=Acropora millepora TaxID=45264 RepID=UPI001CF42676|nr:uncharacterized protein LOC122953827 isoform X3 [Acropora millepora]